MPIKGLSMNNSDWIILAKVTSKSDIRHYNNAKGDGKLFNVELTDSYGTQIQATAFNTSVDKWYELIEVGKVYKISNCSVKIANKRFTSIKNDYCLFISENSRFDLHEDQDVDIDDIYITRTPISQIAKSAQGTSLDLVGMVVSEEEIREIQTKTGSTRKLRTIVVVDNSKLEDQEDEDKVLAVNVQIWGDNPETLKIELDKIIVIKRARTSEFRGGINISCGETNEIYFQNDVKHIREMVQIMKWHKTLKNQNFDFENNLLNISSGNAEGSGSNIPVMTLVEADEMGAEFYYAYVHLEAIRTDERSVYPACPD